jgi:hypothetical protein
MESLEMELTLSGCEQEVCDGSVDRFCRGKGELQEKIPLS